MPVETDYAWAAGFLDGEGCFQAIARCSKPKSYNPQISAVQVDPAPLLRLQELFGGNVCEVKTRRRPGESRTYKWAVMSAVGCVAAIDKLIPYLMLKKEEAEVLLSLCSLIAPKGSNKKTTPINVARRRHLARRLVQIRRDRKLAAA